MQFNARGEMIFEDIFELTYEILNEMDLELRSDGVIIDPVRNQIFFFNGMAIKASTNPNQIHYAGQGEIIFNILGNVRMATTLFGNYIQKKQLEGMPFVSYYQEEQESNLYDGIKLSSLTVRKDDTGTEIISPYYFNKCLKFIWMIFALDDNIVDLSNFDQEYVQIEVEGKQ